MSCFISYIDMLESIKKARDIVHWPSKITDKIKACQTCQTCNRSPANRPLTSYKRKFARGKSTAVSDLLNLQTCFILYSLIIAVSTYMLSFGCANKYYNYIFKCKANFD